MRTESYWFQRYPEGFQCDTAGCTCPFESVARDMIRYDSSFVAVNSNSNRRHAYFACSPASFAGAQVTPLLLDTSTLVMSRSPAHAKPATAILPGFRLALCAGEVI